MDTSGSNDLGQWEESREMCEQGEDDTKQIKEDQIDRYTQNIELYNACRRFYVTRVQVADDIKSKLNKDLTSSGSRSLDLSMEKLREEVVSLIDQDLTLMHQLLTLNERIEELKWHRKLSGYLPAFMATSASSSNMIQGDNTLSDWDVCSQTGDKRGLCSGAEVEADIPHSKYLSPSKLSLFRECIYNSTQDSLHDVTSSSTTDVRLRDNLAQSRTSDLGSSGELVSSLSEYRKSSSPYRLSKGDSCISSGCPSNSSSLKKSDVDEDVMEGMSGAICRITATDNVSEGDKSEQKQCHDSGIHADHNLEMII